MKEIWNRLFSAFRFNKTKKRALQQLDDAWQHAFNKTRHLDHYRDKIAGQLETKQQLNRALFHMLRNKNEN